MGRRRNVQKHATTTDAAATKDDKAITMELQPRVEIVSKAGHVDDPSTLRGNRSSVSSIAALNPPINPSGRPYLPPPHRPPLLPLASLRLSFITTSPMGDVIDTTYR